ncbi:MAG: hypothetical protein A2252_02320 [Elusimicrobia bacterium RIFOXYA2_FULL_39_19]|nr:MAG: hypothetical protein A2252_02320 [Elusimicrobia bacterium RIFOXYA2_FULL_39_19]
MYKREKHIPSIRKVNSIPRIFVDDTELPTILYRNRQHDDFVYMKKFVETGHKLFFMTKIMPSDGSLSRKEYERDVKKRICRMLNMAPDIFVILGYYFSLSSEFMKKNPQEAPWDCANTPDLGSHIEVAGIPETAHYSLYSDKVREEQKKQADFHVDIIESLPDPDRIIGMFFEGGRAQEWYNFNSERHSPAMLKKYQGWLKKRYITDNNFAQAYGKPGLSIAQAEMPEEALSMPERGWLHDPALPNGRASVDWSEFISEEKLGMVLTGPRAVKQRRPDLLCGFFSEHLLDCDHFTDPFKRVVESPYVDFIAGPTGGKWSREHPKVNHSLVASIHLHGKLWFQEEDSRPMKEESREEMSAKGDISRPEHYVEVFTHVSCKNFTEGNYAWWWDFQKRWFKSAVYWPRLKKLQEIDKRHRCQKPQPVYETAVFISESSEYYAPYWARNIGISNAQGLHYTFPRMGAPYGVYLLEDVLHPDFPIERIKVAFFVDCVVLSDKEREAAERLKSNNRTLVFYWASGFGLPKSRGSIYSTENMMSLTGINFLERCGQYTPMLMSLPGEHAICKLYGPGRFFGMVNEQDINFFKKARTPNIEKYDFFPFISINPVFTADDEAVIPLAYYAAEILPLPKEDDRKRINSQELLPPSQFDKPSPVFLGGMIKKFKDWTSVYIGANYIQWELLNCILRASGVHTYLDSGDLIFADSRMVAVYGNDKKGIRKIRLPSPRKVTNALIKDAATSSPVSEFKIRMSAYEAKCYFLS